MNKKHYKLVGPGRRIGKAIKLILDVRNMLYDVRLKISNLKTIETRRPGCLGHGLKRLGLET